MQTLPEDIIIVCLSYVPAEDFAVVCKSWEKSLACDSTLLSTLTFLEEYELSCSIMLWTLVDKAQRYTPSSDEYDECLLKSRAERKKRREVSWLYLKLSSAKTNVGKHHIIEKIKHLLGGGSYGGGDLL